MMNQSTLSNFVPLTWDEFRNRPVNTIEHEVEVWGHVRDWVGFNGFRYHTTGMSERRVYFTAVPIVSKHWRYLLGVYLQSRGDVPRTVTPYYWRSVSEYAICPVMAPLLMDYLSIHPERAVQWEWYMAHVDWDDDIQISEGVWVR